MGTCQTVTMQLNTHKKISAQFGSPPQLSEQFGSVLMSTTHSHLWKKYKWAERKMKREKDVKY